MAFPQSFLDELVARSDIVDVVGSYVALTKKGANYFGLCPFHNEKTGSFSVSPDKQIYHCFGCKKGGGVISFIMEEENLSFPDAVRFLAKRANLPVPEEEQGEGSRLRARLLELNRDAARFYYELLHDKRGEACAEYLNQRRITRRTAVNFGLGASADEWDGLLTAMTRKGYSKAELLAAGLVVQGKGGSVYDKFRKRLIFPVIDVRGDVVAFGGRIVDKNDPGAKYMNSPETIIYSKRRVLYGLNLAKKSKRENIILVEGNIDVVMLHQAGFDNACASMGTALTTEQIRLLSRYTKELILCYDNDNAGRIATQKALELLNDTDFSVRVLELPNRIVDGQPVKQDADDFIKNQGPDAFERLLSGSETGMDFRMARLAAGFDLTSDQGRIDYAARKDAINAQKRAAYAARKNFSVYSSLNMEPKPVTMQSISNVKAFSCDTLDAAGQQQLKNAHKRLLMTASKQPLGVEVGRAYDLNMKPLTKELTGAAERSTVSVPKQNVPYIVIHTHPDSNIFSQRDLSNFANKEISYQEAAESLNFLVRNCLSELEGYGVKFYE